MQLTQGALGMLVQRYRAVLKKCRVLNLLGGTLLGVTLLGGTALAAGPVTIDTTQQVADGVEEEYTTIDVENGGTLNIARQGKVTGTTVTVKAGGALHSAKNLHIGTPGVGSPGTGLLATDTLIIDGGTVTGSHLGFLEPDAALTITNKGSLTGLETLELHQGTITLGGGEEWSRLSVENLTVAKDGIVDTGAANGKIFVDANGQLVVRDMLKLTDGDVNMALGVDRMLDVGGITLDTDTNTYTHTGKSNVQFSGVQQGTFFNGEMIEVKAGAVAFNDKGSGLTQTADAEVKASSTGSGPGHFRVESGTWVIEKLTQTGDGLVLVGDPQANAPARLVVNDAVASQAVGVCPDPNDSAHTNSKGIVINESGTLGVQYSAVVDSSGTSPVRKSTVAEILVLAGGTLDLVGSAPLSLSTLTTLKNSLLAGDSKGTIAGVTVSDMENKKLHELSDASVALPDAVVESDGTAISQGVAVSGITGSATTTVQDGAGLTLTGNTSNFSEAGIALNDALLQLGSAAAANATARTLEGGITMQGAVASSNTLTVTSGSHISHTINGGIRAAGDGTNTISLQGGSHTINGGITTAGTSKNTVNVQGGSHTVNDGINASAAGTSTTINVINDATLTVKGGITGNANTHITVGNEESKGTIIALGLDMKGGRIDFDPPFVADGDTSNASMGGLTFASDTVNALMNVGQNSMVSLGSTDAGWLRNEVANYQNLGHGLWGKDVTAALALRAPQTLDAAGGINVDGTWTNPGAPATADTAKFAAKSLLVVDAAGVGDNVALTGDSGGTSTLTVDAGAKLHIVGGKDNATVHITDGFGASTKAADSWTDDNLTTSSALLSATGSPFAAATGTYSVTLKANDATSIFPRLSHEMGTLVDTMVAQPGINPDSDNAGVRFVSRAVSDNYIGRQDRDKAAATIEGAAQIAPVGAVQASTMNVANVASGAALNRTSLALPRTDSHRTVALHQDADGVSLSGMSAGDGMKNGLGLWLMPLYQTNHVWGMESGNFEGGYHSSLGGIALGADYTVNDMFRFGAAFNIGAGYAQSSGDFNSTDNRFNFWGVSLYGGWVYNNFGLTADVGYTSNYNKLQQDLPASMQMRDLKADVTSHAWNTGLKAEYKFNAGVLDIIPHVGVRYMGLVTDKHDVTSSGDTVFEVDRSVQSIWTFPLGVTLAANLESANGWTFKPQLDLGVIPATGDVKARSKVRIPGVDSSAEMKMQVVDYLTFDGGAGFELAKGDFSVGLNYNLQASQHRTGHGVFGTLRYEF